jgi:hypothetical protein
MSRQLIKARAGVGVTRESPSVLCWDACQRPESEQAGPDADQQKFKVKPT